MTLDQVKTPLFDRFQAFSKAFTRVSFSQLLKSNQESSTNDWKVVFTPDHQVTGWTFVASKKGKTAVKKHQDRIKTNKDSIAALGKDISKVTLQIRTVVPQQSSSKTVETFVVSAIHGNETEISELLCYNFLSEIQVPTVLVPRANLTSEQRKHRLLMGPQGRLIDLNRQFIVSLDDKTWESVMSKAGCVEAKLLYSSLIAHPEIKTIISFHQDNDHGWKDSAKNKTGNYLGKNLKTDGFYMYDIVRDAQSTSSTKIETLKKNLMKVVKQQGFDIFNGVDDHELQNKVLNGVVNESIVNSKGVFKVDGSFESAAVSLGLNGINKVERAFVFEIPGGLSKKRKAELLDIIQKEFLNVL